MVRNRWTHGTVEPVGVPLGGVVAFEVSRLAGGHRAYVCFWYGWSGCATVVDL